MAGTKVAEPGSVPEGKMIKAKAGGRDIAIANIGGKYAAFDDTCTHSGASLSEGALDGCRVVCPWHKAEFDCGTGKLAKFPAKIRDLGSYPVTEAPDGLYVDL